LYALARRPTKVQFVKAYGPKGPAMTWEQRAAAGLDAKQEGEARGGQARMVDVAR